MPRVLMIDNYDSFTYNLVQYLAELGAEVTVWRNDRFALGDVEKLGPALVVISPGPGRPESAGLSMPLIERYAERYPILGVCLGHQAIGYAFGGKIINAKRLMHGKTSNIHHNKKEIFKTVPDPFEATRYHSLVVDKQSLPGCLEVTAWTQDKDREIMGLKHKEFPLWGVQFHPESVLTKAGMMILSNFLKLK